MALVSLTITASLPAQDVSFLVLLPLSNLYIVLPSVPLALFYGKHYKEQPPAFGVLKFPPPKKSVPCF